MIDIARAFIFVLLAIVTIIVAIFGCLIPGLILVSSGKVCLWLGEWLLDGFGVFKQE